MEVYNIIEIEFGESACGSLKIAKLTVRESIEEVADLVFVGTKMGVFHLADEMKEADIRAQEQTYCLGECYSIGRQEQ